MVHGPTASTSPGDLLELQLLRVYPDLLNQQLWGQEPTVCVWTKPSRQFRGTLKFENHCFEQGLADFGLKAKSSLSLSPPTPCALHIKFHWNTYSFVSVLSVATFALQQQSSCDRDHMAHKPKILSSLLQRNVLTSALKDYFILPTSRDCVCRDTHWREAPFCSSEGGLATLATLNSYHWSDSGWTKAATQTS